MNMLMSLLPVKILVLKIISLCWPPTAIAKEGFFIEDMKLIVVLKKMKQQLKVYKSDDNQLSLERAFLMS